MNGSSDPSETFKIWSANHSPKKILAIRYQAMGDVVITLPYLNNLKKQFPSIKLHFLTRKEVSDIPNSLPLFEKVIAIGGGRNAKLQFALTLLKIPFLIFQRYDVVLDLQNHRISRFVLEMLRPKAYCIFDKHSSRSAADRTINAIEGCLKIKIELENIFNQKVDEDCLSELLETNGWKKPSTLIVFNPAGAFDTRHWPVENYISIAQKLKTEFLDAQFLILGLSSKINGLELFKKELVQDLIDLTDKTTPAQAFALLRKCKMIITEDSGLMHMAWVQGIPTLAIFGSSRSDWSSPQGKSSVCLNSSDLPCGNCLLEVCKFGDNHCLTRHTPDFVFDKSMNLLNTMSR